LNIIFFADKGNKWKKLRKEVSVEESRHFVRAIMSKFEVLQNKKVIPEIEKICKMKDLRATYSAKSHTW
jgi:hypothetical protein